jgi:hypothetical protein
VVNGIKNWLKRSRILDEAKESFVSKTRQFFVSGPAGAVEPYVPASSAGEEDIMGDI